MGETVNDRLMMLVELANLDLLLAAGGLKEDQMRAAWRSMTAGEFEPEHVAVKGHGLFQVADAIAGV